MQNDQLARDIEAARLAIRSKIDDPAKTEKLAKDLKTNSQFRYASELFLLLLSNKTATAEQRKGWNRHLAICFYKDPDLPSAAKFEAALNCVRQAVLDLETIQESEFLGITGAIYKRKWQFGNSLVDLHRSEHFYKRGFESWEARNRSHREKEAENAAQKDGDDDGYTAINYAFIEEMIAVLQLREARTIKSAELEAAAKKKLVNAETTRRTIIERLTTEFFDPFSDKLKDKKWVFATLGEAHFGTLGMEDAVSFYKKYEKSGLDEWERRTTTDQLMRLTEHKISLVDLLFDEAEFKKNWKTANAVLSDELRTTGLEKALADKKAELEAQKKAILVASSRCLGAIYPQKKSIDLGDLAIGARGRVGLAFSGGGFRASLFHIGTLARLAELDVLRHVEALSCVSGGSIVGAFYYLLLKREQEKHGDAMGRDHYIGIVRELERDFLAGVQQNLRMRIFANPFKNLRIFLDKDYTRTHRLGELYEKHLYQKALPPEKRTGEKILMHDLRIQPADYPQGHIFSLKDDNWNRRNKVPQLILNATTLNTGHNWQFTPRWMGEPPGNIHEDVDVKPRLRRMYYDEAPAPYRNNVRLGHAVGASSCVPGLFEPFRWEGLFDGLTLELVDGGVHDNQGVASLLEQECKMLLVSDASGQMAETDAANAGAFGVLSRSDTVFQERIRESQIQDLKAREQSSQLTGLAYMHLKKELNRPPVNWKTCQEPGRTPISSNPAAASKEPDLTSYGIRYEVQNALAAIRTDLDAFHESEAWALMYSGYQLAKKELERPEFDYLKNETAEQTWQFMAIQKRMQNVGESQNLLRRLRVGAGVPFKVFRTWWSMAALGWVMLLAAVGGLLFWAFRAQAWEKSISVEWICWLVAGYLVAATLGSLAAKSLDLKGALLKKLGLAVGAFVAAAVCGAYLWILNPVYLAFGRLTWLDREDRLKKWVTGLFRFLS